MNATVKCPSREHRRISINLHDLDIGLWQEDARDPTFRVDVFDELIRHLRQSGWTVVTNKEVRRRFPVLSPTHRYCRKGDFHATLQISGRSIQFQAWAETWPKENQNGHRYDFDKRRRLGFLDGLRFELERRRLLAWARSRFDVEVRDRDAGAAPGRGLSAMEWIAKQYAESWHVSARPGWPRGDSYGKTSAEGATVYHGATVWLRSRGGRWIRGRAYENSGMWWVVTGPREVTNRSANEMHLRCPSDLRSRHDGRRRRERLEEELTRAVRRDDFARAALLKRLLFGEAPIYRIFSHGKHDLFYGANYRGYTADLTAAGRYTRDEAEREVLRVPHLLTLVCPDGRRIRGDRLGPTTETREAAHG